MAQIITALIGAPCRRRWRSALEETRTSSRGGVVWRWRFERYVVSISLNRVPSRRYSTINGRTNPAIKNNTDTYPTQGIRSPVVTKPE